MKFSIRFADQIVGTLVILALVILILAIFLLGRSQRWFMNDYQYKTYFTSASGLSLNMAIQYKGFTIGHVKNISLSEDDRVEVRFTIFEEHAQRVREGSLVEIQISPIGLGSSFIFHPGLGEDLIMEGMLIPEINSVEARQLTASGLTGRHDAGPDSINSIMNQVNLLLETLNASLAGSDGARDLSLGQIIGNVERTTAAIADISVSLLEQLNPILNNVETFTDQIADPSGTIMSILDADGPLYSNLEQALSSLAGIIESLDKTAEFLPSQLPQIGVLISQLNVTINTVQDVLIAVSNNPLLRGGMPQRVETGPGGASPRDLEF